MKNVRKIYLFISILLLVYSAGCDKEVSVTPPEPPLPKGKLFISSFPDEALVFLNGKFTGNLTPDTISFLEKGPYLLTLKKKYFKDITVNVNISEDSLIDLFVDYRNYSGILGIINLDSKPRGADIFIDDSATGRKTPYNFTNIFPGNRLITLKHEDYWDFKANVEIESGKTIYPYITMVDSTVWVNYDTSNSDLPDMYINHVAIDNNNVKWIGTLQKGLVKFDDKNWTVYSSTNSAIPSDFIKFVGVDKQNKVWMCTYDGLITFDGTNWVTYNTQNSELPSNYVNCIAFDKNGDKWIGTLNGLAKFDGVNWTVYNETNSPLKVDVIEVITVDDDGNKWIGTTYQGMAKYDVNGSWTVYNSPRTGFPKNVAGGIAMDKNKVLWLGIAFRSMRPGGVAFSSDYFFWTQWIGTPSENVTAIIVDENNNKWVANGENGLSKYNGTGWIHYTKSNSKIPSDKVMSITIDRSGYKWISTYGGGLSKYKGD